MTVLISNLDTYIPQNAPEYSSVMLNKAHEIMPLLVRNETFGLQQKMGVWFG